MTSAQNIWGREVGARLKLIEPLRWSHCLLHKKKNNLIQTIFFPSSRGRKLTNKEFDEQIPGKLCSPSYDEITHRRNSQLEFVQKGSCSFPYMVSILNSCGFRWFRTVNRTIYTRTPTSPTHKLKPKHTTSTIPLVISVLPYLKPGFHMIVRIGPLVSKYFEKIRTTGAIGSFHMIVSIASKVRDAGLSTMSLGQTIKFLRVFCKQAT